MPPPHLFLLLAPTALALFSPAGAPVAGPPVEALAVGRAAVGGVAAGGVSPRPPRGAISRKDPLKTLRALTLRARRTRTGLSTTQEDSVRQVLREVHWLRTTEPERVPDIDLALVDLAALRWTGLKAARNEGDGTRRRLSAMGRVELDRRLRNSPESFGNWLADGLIGVDSEAEERRILAAELLRAEHLEGTRRALIHTGLTTDLELRESAVAALKGWDDPLVHQFFLDLLEKNGRGIGHLIEHLDLTKDALPPYVREQVTQLFWALYQSANWRDAARARHFIPYVRREVSIPRLVEALFLWKARGDAGDPPAGGSRRIMWEIAEELQAMTGRTYPPDPVLWHNWWKAIKDGRLQLPPQNEKGQPLVSLPTFFGLRPATDRVAFVIDISGSMQAPMGTDGRSRYREAVERFLDFLRAAGTGCRFSVAIFSDGGRSWRSGLDWANSRNIDQVRRWLLKKPPDGGTHLFEGIRTALQLDRAGRLHPERANADTVIVLCDGATASGPAWVEPWMRQNNETAQIVFHCVEIGNSGDGTLEKLAHSSGGDFLRIDR